MVILWFRTTTTHKNRKTIGFTLQRVPSVYLLQTSSEKFQVGNPNLLKEDKDWTRLKT